MFDVTTKEQWDAFFTKELAEQSPSVRNDILTKRFGIPLEGYTYFRSFRQIPCIGIDLSQGDDFCALTGISCKFLRDGNEEKDEGIDNGKEEK